MQLTDATMITSLRSNSAFVAAVSCIYGLGAPVDYGATVLRLRTGGQYRRDAVLRHLVDLQYQRNDQALQRSRFRVRGDTLELVPSSEDRLMRVEFFGDEIERITELDALTGELLAERAELNVYPATHYVTPADKLQLAMGTIAEELEVRLAGLEAEGRALEAARLRQRTTFDLEMMRELGYCTGIENYSRHLSAREPGSRPWTLLDYFPPDWLLVVDESHMSIPQSVGMYKSDRPPGHLRLGHAGPVRAGEEPAGRGAADPAHRDRRSEDHRPPDRRPDRRPPRANPGACRARTAGGSRSRRGSPCACG